MNREIMKEDGSLSSMNYIHSFKLYVSFGEGKKSTTNLEINKKSTGLGSDRSKRKLLEQNNKLIEELPGRIVDELGAAQSCAAQTRKALQQVVEVQMEKDSESQLNPSIAREAGLEHES
jgi:hypothetical protein